MLHRHTVADAEGDAEALLLVRTFDKEEPPNAVSGGLPFGTVQLG